MHVCIYFVDRHTCVCVYSVFQLSLTLRDPMDHSLPGSSVHRLSQARTLECHHFLLQEIFPNQGTSPRLLYLLRWQVDSLPLVPPGKPRCVYLSKNICIHVWSQSCSVVSDSFWPYGLYSLWNSPGQNTGVGSLSLLQGIFLTQESNQSLLHCRQILYQLRYQGSPLFLTTLQQYSSLFFSILALRTPRTVWKGFTGHNY